MNKKEIDNEIVRLIKVNKINEAFDLAYGFIIDKLKYRAKRFFNNENDFIQEASILLYECMLNFNHEKSDNFFAFFYNNLRFLNKKIYYDINKCVLSENKYKRYLNLKSNENRSDAEDIEFQQLGKYVSYCDIDIDKSIVVDYENELYMDLDSILSERELKILNLLNFGYSTLEISEQINISVRLVQLSKYSIKLKINEYLNM